MTAKKIFKAAASMVAMLGILVLVTGSTASALAGPSGTIAAEVSAAAKANAKKSTFGLVHEQFAATGFPTFYQDNFTNPPQIGQKFILEESLRTASGTIIGSNHIECTIIGFTPVPPMLQFACTGTFTFTNGATLKVVTAFNFDPANLPAMYDAIVVSGTGAYAGAFGLIHVTDPGPGNPTGYVFDFYHF